MKNAYVLISCETGSENNIISQLKSLDVVKDAFGTFGSYDIIVNLKTENEDILIDTITKQIRKIQKIRGTLTLWENSSESKIGYKLTSEELETLSKYSAQAYVIIHCQKAKENDIMDALGNIPEIIDGCSVIGVYEMIFRVVAPTYNDISEIVTKKIRKINGIKETITLNVIPEQENNLLMNLVGTQKQLTHFLSTMKNYHHETTQSR